jgi:plasmid replication initiation protein
MFGLGRKKATDADLIHGSIETALLLYSINRGSKYAPTAQEIDNAIVTAFETRKTKLDENQAHLVWLRVSNLVDEEKIIAIAFSHLITNHLPMNDEIFRKLLGAMTSSA